MYGYGDTVVKDDKQAVEWYKKLASQGYAIVQHDLGWMYAKGIGVKQNDTQAVYWYRKAANQGIAKAQYNLGLMYAHGKGVAQDFTQAVYWYRKAANQGSVRSQEALDYIKTKQYNVEQPSKQKSSTKSISNDNIAKIVELEIIRLGYNADLNHLDVSNVTNMKNLFKNTKFNGDISRWDVSKVTMMFGMFESSKFSSDISGWDVSNVTDMGAMLFNSKFNGGISKWDVSNVIDMSYMFAWSKFNGDISKWDVSNVSDMSHIFAGSEFNGDISKWDMSNVEDKAWMFSNSKKVIKASKLPTLEEAIKDIKAKDYKSAFNKFSILAKQGSATAQGWLGSMYLFGRGTEKDFKQAAKWFNKAAAQGHNRSQHTLGLMHIKGDGVDKDIKKGLILITKAAKQGYKPAKEYLDKLKTGTNTTLKDAIKDHKAKDYKSAFSKFLKLAEAGDAIAQSWLGLIYIKGEGVEKDSTQAFKWWTKAAKQGDAYAQHNLGGLYLTGDGVKKDHKKGLDLITKSAKQGYDRAKKFLDKLNKNPLASSGTGFVVTKDGVIATAEHVVDSCKKIKVDSLEASIVVADKKNDIALIKVNKTYQDVANIKLRSPKLGVDIIVFGYPLSDKLSSTHISVTKGSVSSLSGFRDDTSRFRYTAASQPGNSGGPIVNNKGRVVGVVSSVLKNDKGKSINWQNVNFGVRSSLLVNLMDSKNIPVTTQEIPKEEIIGNYQKITKYILCVQADGTGSNLEKEIEISNITWDAPDIR